ncbi:protein GVQW3 [Trichonephila clavipes]|nr:protein GVQW3 [Trichonephila clavipes]
MEKRVVIKFDIKFGKSALETYQLVKQVYDGYCLSRSNVFEWYRRFLNGRDTIDCDQRSGRPISSRTPEIIEKVRNFVTNDHCATLRLIEDSLSTIKKRFETSYMKIWGKRKLVLNLSLTPGQKAMRSAHCRDIISADENDANFLKSIVTGDESRCFQYNSETKR